MAAYTSVDRLLAALPLEADDQPTREALGTLAEGVSGELDELLGGTFGDDEAVTAIMDGTADRKLYLPGPGAALLLSVDENGVPLDPSLYELEPRLGRFLLRLDAGGALSWWTVAERGITLVYVPNTAPRSLQEVCYDECLRRWHAKPGGSQDVAGVDGHTARRAPRGFTDHTYAIVASVRATYFIRNLVAI